MTVRIATVLGDPGGVGPELIARLLAQNGNQDRAQMVVIADPGEWETAMRMADVEIPYRSIAEASEIGGTDGVLLLEHPAGQEFVRAAPSAEAGRYCLDILQRALDLTRDGVTHGLLFAPLNKTSLYRAGLQFEDESQWFAHVLDIKGPHGELNVLDNLWTTRVTSHVALKDVAALITHERILSAIRLAYDAVLAAGIGEPRIAVCGLNPHNGDNGAFGMEEIEIIAPAVEAAIGLGFPVVGPFPADTVFLKAKDYDAIVTMYHDQGQIALKLLGFSRGVTVHGGLPIPVVTPAHGTAFDLFGRNQANLGAMQAAFDICLSMASARLAG